MAGPNLLAGDSDDQPHLHRQPVTTTALLNDADPVDLRQRLLEAFVCLTVRRPHSLAFLGLEAVVSYIARE